VAQAAMTVLRPMVRKEVTAPDLVKPVWAAALVVEVILEQAVTVALAGVLAMVVLLVQALLGKETTVALQFFPIHIHISKVAAAVLMLLVAMLAVVLVSAVTVVLERLG
jgi:hypothetical protein